MVGYDGVVIVRDAKEIARQWVSEEGSGLPGFVGAFFHGSVNWLPDDALLPATSDVDIMVVLEDPAPPRRLGKFRYRNVLLEVSYLPSEQVRTAEQVLGVSHLAGSFHTASVILDPSGRLTRLQAAVARDYAKRRWMLRRCEHVREKMLTGFRLDEADPFPAQVTAWLFSTSLTTHLLLVAGLRNPTVRTRFMAARELLADHGRLDVYETLLELLGSARMTQARAEKHLDALAAAFDSAKAVLSTPFFFAADISDAGRPVAIDGSRELISRGDYREAIFWITATYSRCQLVFHHDAPHLSDHFATGYRELLGDLGIASFADMQQRREEVVRSLPQLWEVAEEIVARNPDKVISSLGDCDK